tara:strand:- start:1645 stop:1830 length:186 start_codon:yes stop_codon:yes gene_type:complete
MSNITNRELKDLQNKYNSDINKNCKFHICDASGIKETKTIDYDLYRFTSYDSDIGNKPAFI